MVYRFIDTHTDIEDKSKNGGEIYSIHLFSLAVYAGFNDNIVECLIPGGSGLVPSWEVVIGFFPLLQTKHRSILIL